MGCFHLEKFFLVWDNNTHTHTHHMITMSAVDIKNANLTQQIIMYYNFYIIKLSSSSGVRV